MDYISQSSIDIKTTPEKAWEALTNPDIVKQYFFGTTVKSDWKEGSDITYSGEWEGKPYEDKGTVLKVVPNERIETSYWSAAFGPDTPENRKLVTYEIVPHGDAVTVSIAQWPNKDEKEKEAHEKNWAMVLEKMKALLER